MRARCYPWILVFALTAVACESTDDEPTEEATSAPADTPVALPTEVAQPTFPPTETPTVQPVTPEPVAAAPGSVRRASRGAEEAAVRPGESGGAPNVPPATREDDEAEPELDRASRLDAARRCAERGDSACVQRLLRGHTSGAPEERLLIEATRALGNRAEADRLARRFLERHPDDPAAGPYRRLLGGGASPETAPLPSGLPDPGQLLGR